MSGAAPLPGQAEDTIVVLDFGSQYSRLIARRIREANVYCEVHPHDTPWERLLEVNPKRIRPVGRTGERLRDRSTARTPGVVSLRYSRSGHLLRHAIDCAGRRWRCGRLRSSRVWSSRSRNHRAGRTLFAGVRCGDAVSG